MINNENFINYLQQVRETKTIDELPTIHLELSRPILTFRLVLFALPIIPCLGGVLSLLLFEPSLLAGILVIIGLISLGEIYKEIKEHKINWIAKQGSYTLTLHPNGFIYQLDGNVREITWQQFSMVEHFPSGRHGGAHITIYTSLGCIEIFNSNLPVNYKKMSLLMYDYYLKATGR